MKKLLIFLLFIPIFMISGCKKLNAAIFLSDAPITYENADKSEEVPIFKPRQKIYFMLVSRKPIECPVVRLQVIKYDSKFNYPISQVEMPLSIDISRGSDEHSVKDYFVLHGDGNYAISIFSADNLDKPIARREFFLQKL